MTLSQSQEPFTLSHDDDDDDDFVVVVVDSYPHSTTMTTGCAL